LTWKQKFDGDTDNEETFNYVFPPPKPLLITNTDSGLMVHAIKMMSGEDTAMHQHPPRMMTASLNSLNSDVFSIN